MRGASLERNLTQSDELDLLLAGQYRGGRLHQALSAAAISTKPTEVEYLRGVVNRILPFVVEERELASSSLRVLVREIVAAAVLQPVIDLLADPDYWNQLVDTYVGAHTNTYIYYILPTTYCMYFNSKTKFQLRALCFRFI